MRVPCSGCGDWTSVQAGSASFRCSCGTLNTLRQLAIPAAASAAAVSLRVQTSNSARLPGGPTPHRSDNRLGSQISAAVGNSAAWKKLLVSMVVLAAFGTVFHQGTFATFNATTTQAAGITTGTLLLGNTVGANAECFSTPSAGPTTTITTNVNNSCTTLFTAPFAAGASGSVNLVMKNEGNLDAATLQLWLPSCATVAASGANAVTVGGTTYQGNTANNLCAQLQITVAETTSGAVCIYGGAACAFDATHVVSGAAGIVQTCTAAAPCLTGGLTKGSTRSFTVAVKFPDPNDNSFQALAGSFSLTWKLSQ